MASLPYITIQPTYPAAFADVSQALLPQETAWLSIYASNAPNASVHSKLLLEPCVEERNGDEQQARDTQGGVRISVHDGDVAVQRIPGSYTDLLVRSPAREVIATSSHRSSRKRISAIQAGPTAVRFSKKTIQTPIKSRMGISAFDVSPTSNNLYVAGGEDGKLFVGSTTSGDALDSNDQNGDDDHGSEGDRIERLAQARMAQRRREAERDRVLKLNGHVGDIRSLRFFPSGEVILSTSSDLTARIFSAKEDSNPRTLKGHKRAVLCSEIIDRGKNVITAGADGTIRLWDIGADRQITSLASERFSSVNQVVLDRSARNVGNSGGQNGQGGGGDAASEGDPFTGRMLAAAMSSGQIGLYELGSKQQVALIPALSSFPPGPAPAAADLWQSSSVGGMFAIDWDASKHIIAAGSKDGVVCLHDDRMIGGFSGTERGSNDSGMQVDEATSSSASAPKSLLGCWRRNGSAINDIRLVLPKDPSNSAGLECIVATADGLPYRASLDSFTSADGDKQDDDFSLAPEVLDEYAEWDCDNVESIGLDANARVWLAGTDGKLRRY